MHREPPTGLPSELCGIAGIVQASSEPSPEPIVERQLASLRHRGPDSKGHWGDERAVIGQRRLAVIDLRTGDPPITDEHGQVCAVLNGEIYNFARLGEELRSDGHRLRSQGDTEVIAHLAERHTPVELARALDGMFAFAVWDKRRQRLVLGRDRVGKKPLYYWHEAGKLVFGSEIKAVLADPRVPRRLNPRAIPAYLTFGYVPTPETFFEGIVSLPPGCVLTFCPGGEPSVERYWRLPMAGVGDLEPLEISMPEATEAVRGVVEAAVKRRSRADVPLGAFLSGGLDSSAIVATMAKLSHHPVRTFTIGFDSEQLFDERPYARLVAERYGTDHHEHVVDTHAVNLIETLLWHHDQPFGDSSALPTYLVSQATRQDVTVAISGDGGDELFGGYERFAAAAALRGYRRVPAPAHRLVRACAARLPPNAARRRVESVQRFTAHAELSELDAYRSWLSFLDEGQRARALGAPDGWALRDYARVWGRSEGADLLTRLLHLNLQTYLLDDLLVKVDRMSMAHGLEVRSPLLDVELLELAFRLPSHLKVQGFKLKRVLAAAFAKDLPPALIGRRKRGFALPLDAWFRGELRPLLVAQLGAPHSRVKKHLHPGFVDELLAAHDSGRRNHGQALWLLLTLELFLRRERW